MKVRGLEMIAVMALLLVSFSAAVAQPPRKGREFDIHYRLNRIDIDPDYLGNRSAIDTIRYYMERSSHIDSIVIYAWASPEGGYEHNKWLSKERAEAARALLLEMAGDGGGLNEGKIRISPLAENWEGLTGMVEADYHRPDRERLLKILHTEGIGEETRKWRIRQLDGGETWEYLKRNYMDRLRNATWICVWSEIPRLAVKEPVTDTLSAPPSRIPMNVGKSSFLEYRTILGLKTNLLFDALTAVNIGVEVPFARRFSVNAHLTFPWWTGGPYGNKYALEILSLDGEFRWWFAPKYLNRNDPKVQSGRYRQRDALVGHYVGIYAGGGKFDIQAGSRTGCYQCHNKGVGLSYGYVMPLGRRLNMEFAVSIGYMAIDYQHYVPLEDWSLLLKDDSKVGTLHYFGPTSLKVNLVYPILVRTRRGGLK